MSISTTATKDSYAGNNSIVTQYPITFKYFEESHISVYFDGVLQTKGAGADYVMGGDGTTSTGYITTNVAQAGTVTVAITLDVPFDQPVVLQETGSLPAKTIEVEGFDRLNMQIRRVWRKLGDVLTFSSDEGGTGSTGTADNLLGFNGSGNIAEIPNTTFLQTANNLSDVDAATARTNLGVDAAGTRFPLSELTDSTISTPTSGQLLSWNGSAWINTSTDADGGMLAGVYDPNTVAGDAFDSSNHTYTPAGTGAVDTTVETKLRESVSVKDFGAVGDGVADDTGAFDLAIASIENNTSQKIYIPNGTYNLASEVFSNASRIPLWVFDSNASITGSALFNEVNSIRFNDYGIDFGGTLNIGKNSGSPTNNDANGGIVFGGYSDRTTETDSVGIRMEGEGSNASNMVIYCNEKGRQTQINIQNQSVWGECNTSGTTVTQSSGFDFSNIRAKFIVINYVKYEIASVDSDTQLTLTTSAGTQTGSKFRISTVLHNTIATISGTTATRVRGELFSASGTVVYIGGVKYTYTYVSGNEITLSSAIGDNSDGILVETVQNDIGTTVLRLQQQAGSNEQSLVLAYNEEQGYFLSSVVTGTGEHRPLRIAMGVKNAEFLTDGSTAFYQSITVEGEPVINGTGVTLGKWTAGGNHPNANIPFNNVSSIIANKSGGGNGGLAIDLYSGDAYSKTPLYFSQEGHWLTGIDNTYDIGSSSYGVRTVYVGSGGVNLNGSKVLSDTGSPEGVLTAPVGSMYTRTDGGAGTTLYIKESGTGNTGWAAK